MAESSSTIKISSKRQVTIPAAWYKELGFKSLTRCTKVEGGLLLEPIDFAEPDNPADALQTLMDQGLTGEALLEAFRGLDFAHGEPDAEEDSLASRLCSRAQSAKRKASPTGARSQRRGVVAVFERAGEEGSPAPQAEEAKPERHESEQLHERATQPARHGGNVEDLELRSAIARACKEYRAIKRAYMLEGSPLDGAMARTLNVRIEKDDPTHFGLSDLGQFESLLARETRRAVVVTSANAPRAGEPSSAPTGTVLVYERP